MRAELRLQWTDASGVAEERALPQGETLIGRSSSCEITLANSAVSRTHARLKVQDEVITIEDLGSKNGVFVNDEKVASADLRSGDEIHLGGVTLQVLATSAGEPAGTPLGGDVTVVVDLDVPPPAESQGDTVVSDDLLRRPVISERDIAASGVEVLQREYAALGGGLGSFCWVDSLRNAGVSSEDIIVIGDEDHPYARYERLCQFSQIPPHERLRSNSESCPDNIWGFPGYAVREAWTELRRLNLRGTANALWRIFGEPVIAESYTPRSGDVFRSIEQEMQRIGWAQMVRPARISVIRKSEEGRLLVVMSESDRHRRRHVVVSARFVHLAVGYPAVRLLPDLAEFRERYGDRSRVVNAYEEQSHIYEHLREHGGTVLLRGRGIVASRIIQRIWEERERNDRIEIIHLHRSQLTKGNRNGLSRRAVKDQFEFQPFNWPKACWSGELRQELEEASQEERMNLLDAWGGTTTSDRRDWMRIIRDGLREGWYRSEFGAVQEMKLDKDDRIVTSISNSLAGDAKSDLIADFVIDCTGLISGPDRSSLLADLIETFELPLAGGGRLRFSDEFELEGLRHGSARLFGSGTMTLGGGPYAPVDSFLGLQFAALRSMDAIYKERPPGLRRLNGLYSLLQWTKWARGIAP